MSSKWLGISLLATTLSITALCSAQNVINPAFLKNNQSSSQQKTNNQTNSSTTTTQTSSTPNTSTTTQQQTSQTTNQQALPQKNQTTPSNTQTTPATTSSDQTNTSSTNANSSSTTINNPTITVKNNTPHLVWILVAPVKSEKYNAFNALSLKANSQAVVQTPTSLFATQMAIKDGHDTEVDCKNLQGSNSYIITLTYNNKNKAVCNVEKVDGNSTNGNFSNSGS